MPPTKWRTTTATTIYDPPIDEFSVLLTELAAEESDNHPAVEGPSVLIITEGGGSLSWEEGGTGHSAALDRPGLVYFIGAGVPVTISADSKGATVYRAFVEV